MHELGSPLRLRLTAGQRYDILLTGEMMTGLDFDVASIQIMLRRIAATALNSCA
jgi:hypothetical protein